MTWSTAPLAPVPDTAPAQNPPSPPQPLPTVRLCDVEDPGPPKWLVKDLWIDGAFGIVGAEPKSWKSYLMLLMGICIATGRRFLDRHEVKQGRVLIFSAEGGPKSLRRRAGQLCRHLGIPIPEDLEVITVPVLRLDDPATVARILATVEQLRPVLLILDPLRELHNGDENDSAAIASILGPLRSLQATTGCAVAVVHHMGKAPTNGNNTRRGGQRLRGTSALHGATESALYLTTEGRGAQKRVTVEAEHKDAADSEPFTLAMHHRDLPEQRAWFEVVEDGDDADERDVKRDLAAAEKRRGKILKAITVAAMRGREPLRSIQAIRETVGGRTEAIKNTVGAMLDEGLIIKDDEGAFRPGRRGKGNAHAA